MPFITAISSWIAINSTGFIVGLVTAFLISLLISISARHQGSQPHEKKLVAEDVETVKIAVHVKETMRVGQVIKIAREESGETGYEKQNKTFEFRKRLWNEPPEGHEFHPVNDYDTAYRYVVVAQKKFKEEGGKDLPWKTSWLDLMIEEKLLFSFMEWAEEERDNNYNSDGDRQFYDGLSENLRIDSHAVYEETDENNKLHGKSIFADRRMWEYIEALRDEEHPDLAEL